MWRVDFDILIRCSKPHFRLNHSSYHNYMLASYPGMRQRVKGHLVHTVCVCAYNKRCACAHNITMLMDVAIQYLCYRLRALTRSDLSAGKGWYNYVMCIVHDIGVGTMPTYRRVYVGGGGGGGIWGCHYQTEVVNYTYNACIHTCTCVHFLYPHSITDVAQEVILHMQRIILP